MFGCATGLVVDTTGRQHNRYHQHATFCCLLRFFLFRALLCIMHNRCLDRGRNPRICETENTARVTTRVYDIEIVATDAAGNVGKKICSAIVVPWDHYDDEEIGNSKGSKKSKSKSKSKQRNRQPLIGHDANDLRREYRFSVQRYELATMFLTWDNSLDTTLDVPPLPLLDIGSSSSKSKSKGKSGGSKGSSSQQRRGFDCPSRNQSKGKGSKAKRRRSVVEQSQRVR